MREENTIPLAKHLATLHKSAFENQRPWSESEFTGLLASEHCFAVTQQHGFALVRVIGVEAELLMLAVHPDWRRTGLGQTLLKKVLSIAFEKGAKQLFLDVGADNSAALNLYAKMGFLQVGLRPGYYPRPELETVDALLFSRALP